MAKIIPRPADIPPLSTGEKALPTGAPARFRLA
jgi:hypothetical protein